MAATERKRKKKKSRLQCKLLQAEGEVLPPYGYGHTSLVEDNRV